MAAPARLNFTGDDEADRLLAANPLALLIGMLLDQQVPMEWAFTAPKMLAGRIGTELTAEVIAGMDPDELDGHFTAKPALHRYPSSMAKRVQSMCQAIVADFGGKPESVWTSAATGAELMKNLTSLPGFGKHKAQIFTAVLAKQLGVKPSGWEEKAGDYARSGYRSIADVISEETLQKVRETKRAKKAAGKKTSSKK